MNEEEFRSQNQDTLYETLKANAKTLLLTETLHERYQLGIQTHELLHYQIYDLVVQKRRLFIRHL
ncbi:hypothetical protein [Nostoc sp. ChiVER01]|uniref:hypothetical protein n=1 Tax=Nostoc sp. ChiVER01 TaxID=3075382 RepID=UPI002AD3340F|nr:hypothetical protein [Nostoc sp. ChiVER01]MDZ8224893.1 hypothetical protein [Nostoc sp. ChiVER01]